MTTKTTKWLQAQPLPDYFSLKELLPIDFLKHPDEIDPNKVSTHYSATDSRELYLKNLKTQPKNWIYRKKKIKYVVNSQGYRTVELSKINWSDTIVILGCSMVAGIGVAEDETLSYFLNKESGKQVLNLGAPGSGMDFLLMNNFLLLRNYPMPWAVVNLFSTIDRYCAFEFNQINFHGAWSTNIPCHAELLQNEYDFQIKAVMYSSMISSFWKSTRSFYGSWFDDTAHYTNSINLRFTNTARDLLHCGAQDNEKNAKIIWKHLRRKK
jgi:hypothetical protein